MPNQEPALSPEDLGAERGEALPEREAMSLLLPGATLETPAVDDIPVAAQAWHGNPDEPHIM